MEMHRRYVEFRSANSSPCGVKGIAAADWIPSTCCSAPSATLFKAGKYRASVHGIITAAVTRFHSVKAAKEAPFRVPPSQFTQLCHFVERPCDVRSTVRVWRERCR